MSSVGTQRFAPKGERTIEEQIDALTKEERECFESLKSRWLEYAEFRFDDEMILRFARCSPGKKKFNEKASWKVMKRFDKRYLDLTASKLEGQLLTQVCRV